MSERHPDEQHSARLLRALIWGGVGLAPVAAISVLVGDGTGSIRFAVLLIAVCVVLLGASLLIRNDPVLLKMDVEDRVAAEVDSLRGELREEIAAAARATGHRVQVLQDEMTHLQIAASPATAGTAPGRAGGGRAPMGAARPATASASVRPASVPPSVASASVRPAVASASVPPVAASASVRPATASASVPPPAPTAPRQRGAASVPSPSYRGNRQPAMAEGRPSRRHAAPDTSTDIAGVGSEASGDVSWSSPFPARLGPAPGPEAEPDWSDPDPDVAWSRPESDPLAPGWSDPEPGGFDQAPTWSDAERSRPSNWSHAERNGAHWSDPDQSWSHRDPGWTEPEPSRGYGLSTGPITAPEHEFGYDHFRRGGDESYGPDPLAVPDRTRAGHRRW